MSPEVFQRRLAGVAPSWRVDEVTESAWRSIAFSSFDEAVELMRRLFALGNAGGRFPSLLLRDHELEIRVGGLSEGLKPEDLGDIERIEDALGEEIVASR